MRQSYAFGSCTARSMHAKASSSLDVSKRAQSHSYLGGAGAGPAGGGVGGADSSLLGGGGGAGGAGATLGTSRRATSTLSLATGASRRLYAPPAGADKTSTGMLSSLCMLLRSSIISEYYFDFVFVLRGSVFAVLYTETHILYMYTELVSDRVAHSIAQLPLNGYFTLLSAPPISISLLKVRFRHVHVRDILLLSQLVALCPVWLLLQRQYVFHLGA